MENETNAHDEPNKQPLESEQKIAGAEKASADKSPAAAVSPSQQPIDNQQELANTREATDIMLTVWSGCLLMGTITAAGVYLYLFGHHLFSGDTPDHWKWLGGLVGFFEMLIRVAVIVVVFVPYTIMSVSGIGMSMRVIAKSQPLLQSINGLFAVGHVILLMPAIYIAFFVLTH